MLKRRKVGARIGYRSYKVISGCDGAIALPRPLSIFPDVCHDGTTGFPEDGKNLYFGLENVNASMEYEPRTTINPVGAVKGVFDASESSVRWRAWGGLPF